MASVEQLPLRRSRSSSKYHKSASMNASPANPSADVAGKGYLSPQRYGSLGRSAEVGPAPSAESAQVMNGAKSGPLFGVGLSNLSRSQTMSTGHQQKKGGGPLLTSSASMVSRTASATAATDAKSFKSWLADQVQFSESLKIPETPDKKEKPKGGGFSALRALTRLGSRKSRCSFSMCVHGAASLPAVTEGKGLLVRWERKGMAVSTNAAVVSQGTARVEQHLHLSCTVFFSVSPQGQVKCQPKPSTVAVFLVPGDSASPVLLAKHEVDIATLMPKGLEDDKAAKPSPVAFSLAKQGGEGGVLVVSFGYEVELVPGQTRVVRAEGLSFQAALGSAEASPAPSPAKGLPGSPAPPNKSWTDGAWSEAGGAKKSLFGAEATVPAVGASAEDQQGTPAEHHGERGMFSVPEDVEQETKTVLEDIKEMVEGVGETPGVGPAGADGMDKGIARGQPQASGDSGSPAGNMLSSMSDGSTTDQSEESTDAVSKHASMETSGKVPLGAGGSQELAGDVLEEEKGVVLQGALGRTRNHEAMENGLIPDPFAVLLKGSTDKPLQQAGKAASLQESTGAGDVMDLGVELGLEGEEEDEEEEEILKLLELLEASEMEEGEEQEMDGEAGLAAALATALAEEGGAAGETLDSRERARRMLEAEESLAHAKSQQVVSVEGQVRVGQGAARAGGAARRLQFPALEVGQDWAGATDEAEFTGPATTGSLPDGGNGQARESLWSSKSPRTDAAATAGVGGVPNRKAGPTFRQGRGGKPLRTSSVKERVKQMEEQLAEVRRGSLLTPKEVLESLGKGGRKNGAVTVGGAATSGVTIVPVDLVPEIPEGVNLRQLVPGAATPLALALPKELAPPTIMEGLGSAIPTACGGMLASMSGQHFSEGGSRLLMQFSRPVVVSREMGSDAMHVIMNLALALESRSGDLAGLLQQVMPLPDISGKSLELIAAEGLMYLEATQPGAGSPQKPAVRGTDSKLLRADGEAADVEGKAVGPLPGPLELMARAQVKSKAQRKGSQQQQLLLPSHWAQWLALQQQQGSSACAALSHLGARGMDGAGAGGLEGDALRMEELVPFAIDQLEGMALEGLRIGSGQASTAAPSKIVAGDAARAGGDAAITGKAVPLLGGAGSGDAVLPVPALAAGNELVPANLKAAGGAPGSGVMNGALSLDQWEYSYAAGNAGTRSANEDSDTLAVLAAHNAIHGAVEPVTAALQGQRTPSTLGRLAPAAANAGAGQDAPGEVVTIAMLVQLRDPLRSFEAVGVPMVALLQAEQVSAGASPQPAPQAKIGYKAQKALPQTAEDSSREGAARDQSSGGEDSGAAAASAGQGPYSSSPGKPRFRLVGVHMMGLETSEGSKRAWGKPKTKQTGSRWVAAHGMASKKASKNSGTGMGPGKRAGGLGAEAPPQVEVEVKSGDTLWSLSQKVHGDGLKWKDVARLNPHIRNPDLILPHDRVRMF